MGIITRHSMSEMDLPKVLEWWSAVRAVLAELEAGDRAQVVQRYGMRFWSVAPSQYPMKL